MILRDELTKRTKDFETILKEYLPKEQGLQCTIFSAMNYSLLTGGKRIRPIFLLEFYRLFSEEGSINEIAKPFAAAIEMIHTYSLVHDDLPAMDNDKYRRGKLTTHAVYGEALGILAGDALLNYAFETACTAFSLFDSEEEKTFGASYRIAKALRILSKKSGCFGMIGGQTVDVLESGKLINSKQLDFIYRLKTSALLEAAMMIGAVLAGAPEESVLLTEQIASEIGMAFQIKDDILDITSTQEVLGKPIHSDEKNNKTTYVTLFGLSKAELEVKRLSRHAIELLDTFSQKDNFLRDLILFLVDRSM